MFFWLLKEEVPIDVRRPAFPDNVVKISQQEMMMAKIAFAWFIPLLLSICAISIWIRRKRQ